jgi:hypothetical protein
MWLYHPSLDAWQQQEAERLESRTLAVATMTELEREIETKWDARFRH